jgi:predicted esterase
VTERTIETPAHGRYVVASPVEPGPAPLLVGFHGYAEPADVHLERLRSIPGAGRWLIVSVQGLNRFYQRRTNEVVAGWMTRQNRELAIADNLAYVSSAIDAVRREWPATATQVFAGFSQGVAMTFRAAAAAPRSVSGVIAVGGDVPPELDAAALNRVRSALVCRGSRDEWYTDGMFANDLRRLRDAGVEVTPIAFDGGHEWSAEVVLAASAFLRDLHP